MKNKIFFVVFLTSITCAMQRGGGGQTVLTMTASRVRLHEQRDEKDSHSCCSVFGNLIVNAPAAICYISAHYAITQYIQTLEYLGNQINPDNKLKAE